MNRGKKTIEFQFDLKNDFLFVFTRVFMELNRKKKMKEKFVSINQFRVEEHWKIKVLFVFVLNNADE